MYLSFDVVSGCKSKCCVIPNMSSLASLPCLAAGMRTPCVSGSPSQFRHQFGLGLRITGLSRDLPSASLLEVVCLVSPSCYCDIVGNYLI